MSNLLYAKSHFFVVFYFFRCYTHPMKLVLAPMAAITHQALRLLIQSFGGCDEYFTEMIQAGTLLTGGPFEKYYLLQDPEPQKIVWQITGNKKESMGQAAALLSDLGGVGVDINMGCCAPDIVRTGAGIAWMLKPISETEAMVKEVAKNVKKKSDLRFSVKIRLGGENFTKESLQTFIDMLVCNGVEQITLHPRTEKEKYRNPPRYRWFSFLCDYVEEKQYPVSLVLNGGIQDSAGVQKIITTEPRVSTLMIGRAALQKPWIFSQIQGSNPESVDLLQLGFDFIDNLMLYQPPEFYKTRLQRFFAFYSDNVQFAQYLRTQLLNHPTPEGCKKELEKYFEQCPHERYKNL